MSQLLIWTWSIIRSALECPSQITDEELRELEEVKRAKPHHRRAVILAMRDLKAARREYLFPLPTGLQSLLIPYLNKKEDIAEAMCFFNCYLFVAAGFASFLLIPPGSAAAHLFGVCWVAFIFGAMAQRFSLCLHYTSHVPLFSSKLGFLGAIVNGLPPLILAPFWGIPSAVYIVHHCVMHHVENNVAPEDLTSTAPYQRDSLVHFLHYWWTYVFRTAFHLAWYTLRRGMIRIHLYLVCGLAAYGWALWKLYCLHSTLATYMLIVPFFISSFALMYGNWSQHIFVNPDRNESNYSLTYNCLGAPFNQLTFNDGYHITHHINAKKHWSELPLSFLEHIDKYAENGALCFEGLCFDQVSYLVFSNQLEVLAKSIVSLCETPKTLEENVAYLRRCLKPIPSDGDKAQ